MFVCVCIYICEIMVCMCVSVVKGTHFYKKLLLKSEKYSKTRQSRINIENLLILHFIYTFYLMIVVIFYKNI